LITTPFFAIGAGVGLAYIVGRDGSPAWQLTRVLAVLVITTAVVLALWFTSGRARAVVAIGFGLLACGVGGGIGIPHASKVGYGLTTLAGLTTLGAGLALVALGTLALVRSTRGWWQRLAVLVAVVLVAYLTLGALGLAVAVTNVPPTDLANATPEDVGLRFQDVTFPASDGIELAGWYIPSTNGDAVLLLHGAGSTRTSVLKHAAALNAMGYGVLLFDSRGHGESNGRAMDLGWYGDRDIAGAVDLVRAQPDVGNGRVLAVGMSMGGEEAIGALATDPRLCATVAEGATGRVAADHGWLSSAYGLRGWVQEGFDRLRFRTTDLLTDASPPISLRDAVREAAPRSVLLIASRRVQSEPHAAESIEEASPSTVDVWVAPGAAHTGAFEARRSEWIDRVKRFLDEAEC